VDAGAIGEMVVNGIHLGIISGINAAELRNLEKIYDDVIKQGKPIEGWIWPGIQGSLPTLGSIATRGSGLGMGLGGLGDIFGERYPGWITASGDWFDRYKNWVRTALDTAAGAAGVASQSYAQMVSEIGNYGQLQGFVASAIGRNADIQAGNQINMWTAANVEQVNATLAAQLAADQAYYGYQIQTDAAKQAVLEKFFKDRPSPLNGKSYNCCN
jgi:P-type conjugative transfer protein TrbJ